MPSTLSTSTRPATDRRRPPAVPGPRPACGGWRPCRRSAGPAPRCCSSWPAARSSWPARPRGRGGPLYLRLLRHRWVGAGPGRAAGAARADAGRRPADDRGRARRGGDRAGLRRRAADRHLRDLRRAGGVATRRTEDSVRGLLDLAPEHGHPAGRRRRRGDRPHRRPRRRATGCWSGPASGSARTARCWTGPARSTRPPSPASRCRSPSSAGDEVFAGTLNGTGALRGAGRARPPPTR